MKKITLTIILCSLLNSLTAQINIQGIITDEIGPLEWANVYIKNTTTGTTTDGNGNFTLEVKKGDTLSISYTGYQTQKVVIDNREFISVILENESLDEIILTDRRPRKISCGFSYTTIIVTEEITKITPTLFPNPSTNGIFHLKMPSSYQEVEITVSNLLGQQVYSKIFQNTSTNISFDVSHVKTGIYLINAVADGQHLPTQKAIRK